MDHYRVLGVPTTATAAAIRTAYRRLALALHPDRAGRESTEEFRRVAAAYEVLSDPLRREKYDAQQLAMRSTSTVAASGSKQLIPRLSGPLRSLLAAGLLRTIGEDAYELWLTASEAAAGGYIQISTSPPKQFCHWLTIPTGVMDGAVVPSVLRVSGEESVLRLHIRVFE